MATWEDGPEYAPLERPSDFTVGDVAPLSVATPPPRPPEAPGDRPQFGDPSAPVAPLDTLVPEDDVSERDPKAPFDVDSDTMSQGGSSGSAWGAAHWRPPAGAPVQQPGPWGPPAGRPSHPDQPMALHAGPAQQSGNLPAPGTPAWFGPGPARAYTQPKPTSVWKAVPPAIFILLGLSLLWFCAPITYLIAFILSARLQYARKQVLTAFGVVFGVAVLISTAATLLNYGDLGSWYGTLSTWSLLGAILMFILVIAMVNNELRDGRGGYPRP
jgi:hypothetical protein